MAARMATAAGLALLCGMANAVPTSSLDRLTWAQTVEIDAGFAESASSIEAAVAQVLTDATGATHVTATVGAEAHRRLQTGTTLTIQYAIVCGTDCDSLSAQLDTIANDPDAGLQHATAIIAAINTVSAAAGFGQAVISSPTEVVATIQAPTSVAITLPPIPAPPPAPAPVESCTQAPSSPPFFILVRCPG